MFSAVPSVRPPVTIYPTHFVDTSTPVGVGLRPDSIHMKAKTFYFGLVKVTCRSRQKRAFGATPSRPKKFLPWAQHWRAEHERKYRIKSY